MTTVPVRMVPPRSEVAEKTTEPGRLAAGRPLAAAWMAVAAVTAFSQVEAAAGEADDAGGGGAVVAVEAGQDGAAHLVDGELAGAVPGTSAGR